MRNESPSNALVFKTFLNVQGRGIKYLDVRVSFYDRFPILMSSKIFPLTLKFRFSTIHGVPKILVFGAYISNNFRSSFVNELLLTK